jgi:hypothetical protein
LDSHARNSNPISSSLWCLQLSYMALKFGEATRKNFRWKVFNKGMKIHTKSYLNARSSTTYHTLWVGYGELPIELCNTSQNKDLTLGTNRQPFEGIKVSYLNRKPWQPTTSKNVFDDDIKKASLAREWNSFQLLWKKLYYLPLKDFLKYECELYLKQPLTPPHHNIIDAYGTSNHRLAIEIGRWFECPCL